MRRFIRIFPRIKLVKFALSKKAVTRFLVKFGYSSVFAGCALTAFCSIIGYPAAVCGVSMSPTLNGSPASEFYPSFLKLNVDWVFVNCYAVNRGQEEVRRGEIVVFISPRDPYDYVIKRVIGLEEDVVERARISPYTPITVPKGHCWVEGDNRDNSIDSYSKYGPISKGLIFGKATHVIWPPERWAKLMPKVPEKVQKIAGNPNKFKIVN